MRWKCYATDIQDKETVMPDMTPITAVWSLDIEGEVTMWEAAVRCCPALVGLVAYVFTRLYESREWIAEHASKFMKKKTE